MEEQNDFEEINKSKFSQFTVDFADKTFFSNKIKELYKAEFEEVFQDILLIKESEIISSLTYGVKTILTDIYTETIFQNKKLTSLLQKEEYSIKKEYQSHIKILNNSWNSYESNFKSKSDNNSYYLTNYRKHCSNSNDFAYHSCTKQTPKFLEVKKDNKTIYAICTECKKCYFSDFILCNCSHCNINFYSSVLQKEENPYLLLATWEKYHCDKVVNEKMKCLRCKSDIYLNLNTKMLICINNDCGFTKNPMKILWKCTECKRFFRSDAIVYNPLNIKVSYKIIKQTLLIKLKAHPNRVPCCKLNVYFNDFYHKGDCNGILYIGEFNSRIVIVCDKCKDISYYDKFVWICPKCGKSFKDGSQYNEIQMSFGKKRVLVSSRKEPNIKSNSNIRKTIEEFKQFDPVSKDERFNRKNNGVIFNFINVNKENFFFVPGKEIQSPDFTTNRSSTNLKFTSIKENEKSQGENNKGNEKVNKMKNFKIPLGNFKYSLIWRNNNINKEEEKNSESGKIDSKVLNGEIKKKNEREDDKKEKQKKQTVNIHYCSSSKINKIDNKKDNPLQEQLKCDNHKPRYFTPKYTKKEDEINKLNEKDFSPKVVQRNQKIKNLQEAEDKKINKIKSIGKLPKFDLGDYTIIKKIGEGSYGVIFMVENNKTKSKFAIKKIIARDLKEVESFKNEFELVHSCEHQNIMKVYGIHINQLDKNTYSIYLLMELADRDWDDDIRNHLINRKPYKEEELINIIKQLVCALNFMQINKISHRDIKPKNVLLFGSNVYKMADFGEAKEVKISKQLNTLRGTQLYMSPILYEGLKENKENIRHNSFKSDVYSLGFCLLYAATLNFGEIFKMRKMNEMDKVESVLNKHLSNKYSKRFIELLITMLQIDEMKRKDFIGLNKYINRVFSD